MERRTVSELMNTRTDSELIEANAHLRTALIKVVEERRQLQVALRVTQDRLAALTHQGEAEASRIFHSAL